MCTYTYIQMYVYIFAGCFFLAFFLPQLPDSCGAHPRVHWVLGSLLLVVRWPERDRDHSPPHSVEEKKDWSFSFTLPTSLLRVT
jgi:hypothetical protein